MREPRTSDRRSTGVARIATRTSPIARIASLAENYSKISAQLKELELQKKLYMKSLLDATKEEASEDEEGRLRLEAGGYNLCVTSGESAAHIDPQKLRKLGVKPTIIAKATVAGTKFEYVRITKVKEQFGKLGIDLEDVG